jgi:undecaprenyl-diphosphatase
VNGFDRHVTASVVANRTPALDTVMKAVTWFGSWVALALVGGVIVLLVVRRRLPLVAAAVAVIAWGGESGAVTLAKHLVQRPRPPRHLWLVKAHGWSWPSGHTAVAVVVFTAAAVIVTILVAGRPSRFAAWGIGATAVLLMAFSRIELGVHWCTDVLASLVFVSGWLFAVFLVCSGMVRRHMAVLQAAPEVPSP